MLTSVVIPCLDRADDTRACLRSLAMQAGAGDVEVILVDNGSADPQALAAAAQAFPRVTLLRLPRNLGFAGGTNRGLAAARGDVLVVLNNDTMAAPAMLARMLRARAATPRPALVAPVSNYVKGSALLPVGDRGSTDDGRVALDLELAQACGGMLQDVDALAGLCLLFDRALLDQVGGFDEQFGLGNFEDDDFALRVRLRGGRLVVARDAFLHHWGSRTFTALGVDYEAQLRRNAEVMHGKWQREPAWLALRAAQDDDVDTAAEHSRAALAAHPDWPEGHLFLAQAARAHGEHDAARAHAERFLRACPASWPGHVAATLACLDAGDLRAGTRAAEAALAQCHVGADVAADLLAHLASACIARGARAAAREALAAAIELLPRGDRLCQLGALHFAAGAHDDAARAFAAGDEQGHVESTVNLGVCQWRAGQPGDALRTFARAVTRAPDSAPARGALATALAAYESAGVDVRAARATLLAAR